MSEDISVEHLSALCRWKLPVVVFKWLISCRGFLNISRQNFIMINGVLGRGNLGDESKVMSSHHVMTLMLIKSKSFSRH